MNKITLLIISIFIMLNSFAKWSPIIESKYNSKHYVDASSVKTDGDIIHYWALEDSANTDMFGAMSKAWYIKADCKIKRYKILSTVLYKSQLGKNRFNKFYGSYPSWDYPTPGSVAYLEITHMCNSLMKGQNR